MDSLDYNSKWILSILLLYRYVIETSHSKWWVVWFIIFLLESTLKSIKHYYSESRALKCMLYCEYINFSYSVCSRLKKLFKSLWSSLTHRRCQRGCFFLVHMGFPLHISRYYHIYQVEYDKIIQSRIIHVDLMQSVWKFDFVWKYVDLCVLLFANEQTDSYTGFPGLLHRVRSFE